MLFKTNKLIESLINNYKNSEVRISHYLDIEGNGTRYIAEDCIVDINRGLSNSELCNEIPYYSLRHHVKPGITGRAQICFQYGASLGDTREKLQYDLYYLKNNTLFLDILILIQTAAVIFLGKGAR